MSNRLLACVGLLSVLLQVQLLRADTAVVTLSAGAPCCDTAQVDAADFSVNDAVEITPGAPVGVQCADHPCEPPMLQLPDVRRLDGFQDRRHVHEEQESPYESLGAGPVHRALFCNTARFPRKVCSAISCSDSFDGVVIYEGMEFCFNDDGHYTVEMNLSGPALPAALRLQLLISPHCQEKPGECCEAITITLRPIVVRPSVDSLTGQMLPGEYTVSVTGYNPCLAQLKCRCDEIEVARSGVARYGDTADTPTGVAVQ